MWQKLEDNNETDMKKEPNFQPLSMILTVFMVEKGLLDSSKQQLENLKT